MKIDYCIHTHTARCGHARGIDEHYVLEAIDAGIKVLGFSDHVFLPNYEQPGIRGNYSQFDDYLSSIKSLKEKYKDKIQIFVGFECEYFDEYLDYYKSLKDRGIDYLILGQHFFMDDGKLTYLRNHIEEEDVERYFEYAEKAIKSGLFTYFAHPDLYVTMKAEFDEQCKSMAERICELSLKYDVPLEINLNGMTWTLPAALMYPNDKFWEIAGKYGVKVTIGYDAHWPEFFKESKYIARAFELVEKYNLNLINKEEIVQKITKK